MDNQTQTPEVETGLTKIINESGLDLSDSEIIKQSYTPFFIEIASVKEDAKKINFENPTELDELIAGKLRKRLVKVRTGSEAVKESRKKIHLLRGKVEQDSWNLIKSGCLLEEENLEQVEKKREIEQQKLEQELFNKRLKLLSVYVDNTTIYPLAKMSDADFENLLNGMKSAKEAKEKAEREAELLRIETARIEAERIEAQRTENERLKAEAKIKEDELKKEREASLKLQKEQELKAQKEREAIEEKARKEREKVEAQMKAEREASAKIAKELQDKKDAEVKRINDEKAAIEKANKLKAEIEKKAAKAPDKTKLIDMIENVSLNISFSLASTEAITICDDIEQKFTAFKKWAKSQIETL